MDHVTHRLVDVRVDRSDEEGLLFGSEAVQVENFHLFGNSALSRLASSKEKKAEGQASLLVLGKLGLNVLVRLQGILVKLSALAASHLQSSEQYDHLGDLHKTAKRKVRTGQSVRARQEPGPRPE